MELNVWNITLFLIGVLFVIIGFCMPKSKQNSLFGVRVKWTLENVENWTVTHRIASVIWIIGGLVFMTGIFFSERFCGWALVILVPLLVLFPVLCSYLYYKKQLQEGTWKATVFENELPRWLNAFLTTVIVLVLMFAGILCFTGDINVKYNEKMFSVEATYWKDLNIEYDMIENLEYRDSFDKGYRINGFGSPILSMGTFKNDEFSTYTLYNYSKNPSAVVLKIDGKTVVIGGKNEISTRSIYDELVRRTLSV